MGLRVRETGSAFRFPVRNPFLCLEIAPVVFFLLQNGEKLAPGFPIYRGMSLNVGIGQGSM